MLSYGMVVGLISVLALVSVTSTGSSINTLFSDVGGELGSVAVTGAGSGGGSGGGASSPSPAASPSASASPVYAVWDASASSPGVTLSAGNLKASLAPAVNNLQGARATRAISSGKYYWEVTLDNTGGNIASIGIGNASWHAGNGVVSTTPPNSMTYEDGTFIAWYSYSGTINPNSNGLSIGAFAAGTNIRLALDMDAGQLWFGDNGAGCRWRANGGGTVSDPPVGAAIITGLSGSWSPVVGLQAYSSNGASATANLGDSPFACPVPTGFTSGVPE